MGPEGTILIIVAIVILLIVFFSFFPVGLWISSLASGVHIPIFTLLGMRIRRIQPKRLVYPLIKARKAGLDLTITQLETHYLAGGNVDRVINALIAAADDYQELKTGHRMTGAFFSCSSVGIKVGTGLGTALSGILVDMAKVNFAEGAVQTAATRSVIKWGYLLPTLLFPIMTLLVLSAMDVEEKSAQLRKDRDASEQ